MTLRIANAAGFLGDQIDAPRRLVESAEVDYLTLEYLAELTLSILARQREKDPSRGYARDFISVLESLGNQLSAQPQLKIVTNAGGMNPTACAQAAATELVPADMGPLPLSIVSGDDLLARLPSLLSDGFEFCHLDTGQPLAELEQKVVSANAYLGAAGIIDALGNDARIVITGRVADAALTLGPAWHKQGWAADDLDALAGASVAGHLIECGAQVTGGYATDWKRYDLADVGYPIAEVALDGSCTISKPTGSGGRVNRQTVVEQLVYEIGDPAHYLTPDVDIDFTSIEVDDLGSDRVRVFGARGNTPPEDYKVSLAFHDGYTASGQLLVYGADCADKARVCADLIRARLTTAGLMPEKFSVELLGLGDAVAGVFTPVEQPRELILRLTVRDKKRAAVERFTKEIAPLVTSGPAGLAGYASSRSVVRPVFAYWPCTVPKSVVDVQVETRAAKDWLQP